MSIRKVQVSPGEDITRTIRDDILNHADDTTYEALFIIAGPVKYNYNVTCENFPAVRKDQDYISRCIMQAKFEDRHPSAANDWFPDPQPFKAIRVPKEDQTAQPVLDSIVNL